MNIYIASKYPNKHNVAELAEHIESWNHTIVSSWHTEGCAPNVELSEIPDSELRNIAERDISELTTADLLLVYTHECGVSRGGMWVEMGYAIASDKRVFILGHPITVFGYLDGVESGDLIDLGVLLRND